MKAERAREEWWNIYVLWVRAGGEGRERVSEFRRKGYRAAELMA